jgi:cytochrome c-type biogenesis protein CcmF
VAEPSTKHYLTRDIYTHITYADLESLEKPESPDAYLEATEDTLAAGDTISTSNSLITFKGLSQELNRQTLGLKDNDIAVAAILEIIDINKKSKELRPVFIIKDQNIFSKEVIDEELGLKIAFRKIDPQTGKIILAISEKKDNKKEFIIMKAIVFPFINVLWTGCILLVIGTLMAVRKRFSNLKQAKT